MKKLLVVISILTINGSCGNHQRNSAQSKGEDFDSFYLKFNQDLDFQNSRITYPLKGKNYSRENKNTNFDYNFTLNDHLDFENHKLDKTVYSINRKVADGVVEEKLFIPNSEFQVEYTFKLMNGKWFLVYYAEYDED